VANVKYTEGDWFAVPLRDAGFGVGLLARASRPQGVLLGYFFGPRRRHVPELADVQGLRPEQAVLVRKCGHLGLRDGTWPILGRNPDWDPAAWPMPIFVRYEELTGRSFHVFYDENDPNKLLREVQITAGPDEQGPKDGLMGAGFTEKLLTTLLS
jgi:hypothetical protein